MSLVRSKPGKLISNVLVGKSNIFVQQTMLPSLFGKTFFSNPMRGNSQVRFACTDGLPRGNSDKRELQDEREKYKTLEQDFCTAMSVFSKFEPYIMSIADESIQKKLRGLFDQHERHRREDREVLIKNAKEALEGLRSELTDVKSKETEIQHKITQLENFIKKHENPESSQFLDRETDGEIIKELNRITNRS